ncbi:hypothetical protein GCM10023317_10600 [Actinopolymorpha pittospori]
MSGWVGLSRWVGLVTSVGYVTGATVGVAVGSPSGAGLHQDHTDRDEDDEQESVVHGTSLPDHPGRIARGHPGAAEWGDQVTNGGQPAGSGSATVR